MRISTQAIAESLLLASVTYPAWAGILPTLTSRSAPGPMIGVGLPALGAYAAYIWIRRRQRP